MSFHRVDSCPATHGWHNWHATAARWSVTCLVFVTTMPGVQTKSSVLQIIKLTGIHYFNSCHAVTVCSDLVTLSCRRLFDVKLTHWNGAAFWIVVKLVCTDLSYLTCIHLSLEQSRAVFTITTRSIDQHAGRHGNFTSCVTHSVLRKTEVAV